MINIPVMLASDSYKQSHELMYPKGMNFLYSNLTPRKSRIEGVDSVVVFGVQAFIKKYLIEEFNQFFSSPLEKVLAEYERVIHSHLGKNVSSEKLIKLHELGYVPLKIKCLPEGSLCPIQIPMLTIQNTHPKFAWLTNFIETILCNHVWQPMTSATIARQFRKVLNEYAMETVGNTDHVQWQGHSFGFRGMSSLETAMSSDGGFLTSFTGSDTIPAILWLEHYYNANCEKELVSGSVMASEHSIACSYGQENEEEYFSRMIDLCPDGVISIVADTWSLWDTLTKIAYNLKDKILSRKGKVVWRPDSSKTTPVDIICGEEIPDLTNKCDTLDDCSYWMQDLILDEVREQTPHGECGIDDVEKLFKFKNEFYKIHLLIDWNRYDKQFYYIDGSQIQSVVKTVPTPEQLGVVELLWNCFGGTVNHLGYKELNPCVGDIYGDSITVKYTKEICERLKVKGFASNTFNLGIGSYTLNMQSRDSLGFAMKATYCEIYGVGREIQKSPVTDSGMKKSRRGLLQVYRENGILKCKDECTWSEEAQGELKTVFEDGRLLVEHTLSEIRERVRLSLVE